MANFATNNKFPKIRYFQIFKKRGKITKKLCYFGFVIWTKHVNNELV